MPLFEELKRRNVFRVAIAYVLLGWAVLQGADFLLDLAGAPDWVIRVFAIAGLVGFPFALFFAWAFELTPEGVKREKDIDRSQPIPNTTGRKLNGVIIGLLLVIIVLMGVERMFFAGSAGPGGDGEVAEVPKTIAVLPFTDLSQAQDQGWFADGLAEEILNALVRVPDLSVAARTSSFTYKGSDKPISEIAAELGVAHVLEGSVRSAADRIRVTAQLIRASDGFHLWSQNYDRDVADMIEIQEDLARQIAVAMQTSMDPQALSAMAGVGTRSVEAYQAYIRGVAKTLTLDASNFKDAYGYFEQARTLDPNFAAAHARAADFWLVQLDPTAVESNLTQETPERIAQLFGERIDQAIAHAANAIDGVGYRAQKAQRDLRLREAIELARALLAERPGDSDAIELLLTTATKVSDRELATAVLDDIWPQALVRQELAFAHVNSAHRNLDRRNAADLALELLQRWPDQPALLYQIHRALLWDLRVQDAAAVFARWQSQGGNQKYWAFIPPARQACAEDRRADAEAIFAQIPEADISQQWHLLMLLGRTREAAELLQPLERAGNTFALAGFLVYPHFDPAPFPSLLRILEREKVQRPPPVPLPFACPPAEAKQ